MMLVSRTPLRISFFGGGTDYPEYFSRAHGAVLGMAIDKYVYIAALQLSSVLDYRYRISYSRIETVSAIEDIQHPVVRNVLSHFRVEDPLDLSIMADLPARSGLGSSSSFTVGLLNLVNALQNRQMTKYDLARTAIFVEQQLLAENVGVQDQYHATYGGLSRYDFRGGRTQITPVQMTAPCFAAMTGSLFLLYTGKVRFASAALTEQMERMRTGTLDRSLSHLLALTYQAVDVLEGTDPERMLAEFGGMLHEGWETKKSLSSKVSNPDIDALYDAARAGGALGGKLCGAGSGGFLLVLVPPARQAVFRERLRDVAIVPVGLDVAGSVLLSR